MLPLPLLLAREPTHCQTVSLAVEPQRASVPACGSNRMRLNSSVPPFLDHPVLLNPAFSHLPYRLHHCTDWNRWQGDWSCEEGGVTHRFFVLWQATAFFSFLRFPYPSSLQRTPQLTGKLDSALTCMGETNNLLPFGEDADLRDPTRQSTKALTWICGIIPLRTVTTQGRRHSPSLGPITRCTTLPAPSTPQPRVRTARQAGRT